MPQRVDHSITHGVIHYLDLELFDGVGYRSYRAICFPGFFVFRGG